MKKQFLFALFVAFSVLLVACSAKSSQASSTKSSVSSNTSSNVTKEELFDYNGTDSEYKLNSSEFNSLVSSQTTVSEKTNSKNNNKKKVKNKFDKNGDGWTDGWN